MQYPKCQIHDKKLKYFCLDKHDLKCIKCLLKHKNVDTNCESIKELLKDLEDDYYSLKQQTYYLIKIHQQVPDDHQVAD